MRSEGGQEQETEVDEVAELGAKVKSLRDELFSFRRDLSLQGTELQGLKDEYVERLEKQKEIEVSVQGLRDMACCD